MIRTVDVRKRKLLWKTVAIVAALITVIVLIVLLFIQNADKSSTQTGSIEKQINNSQVGSELNNILTVDDIPAASLTIAPADTKWWNVLLDYTNNNTLRALNVEPFLDNAQYVAFSQSNGNDYKTHTVIGLPTTFIVYNTAEDAQNVVNNNTQAYRGLQQINNIVFFLNEGAQIDTDYVLNNLNEGTAKLSELKLDDKAYTVFNLKSFLTSYLVNTKSEDKETTTLFLGMLGITDNTTWSGVSDDGLTWEGEFTNVDFSKARTPKQVEAFLRNTALFDDGDGNLTPINELEVTGSERNGTIHPKQSQLFYNGTMFMRTATEAIGKADTKDESMVAPLSGTDTLFEVNIKLNDWLASMTDDIPYLLTAFETFNVKLLNNEGKSVITLTRLPDEQYDYYVNKFGELPTELPPLPELEVFEGPAETEATEKESTETEFVEP